MGRTLVICVLSLCAVFTAATHHGYAQTASPSDERYFRCSSWMPVEEDEKGTQRRLLPIRFDKPLRWQGLFVEKDRVLTGKFEISGGMWVSLISEPGKETATWQFVTLSASPVDFVDATGTFKKVRNGRFEPFELQLPPDYRNMDCVKGDSTDALEAAPALGDFFNRRNKSGAAKLGDRLAGAPPTELRAVPEAPPREAATLIDELPRRRADQHLADLFAEQSKSPSPGGAAPGRLGASRPPPRPPRELFPGVKAPLSDPAKPSERSEDAIAPDASGGAVTGPSVCRADSSKLTPLSVPNGARPKSPQTVGIRNNKGEAKGSDYDGVSGNVFSLDADVDIADSRGKLVPYEPVATRRDAADSLWVSFEGLDETRIRRALTKAMHVLRILVVAGAQELSISGLELVDAELRKQSSGQIGLDVEWYVVDESGSIKRTAKYSSFNELVTAAADKAAGRRPDVLNETQLTTLLNDFERVLKAQKDIVDKVFWIKGAYPIPSAIPQRFEKFIATISSSSAVAHTPHGLAMKWLIVVSARMRGFSIAYLKEPVDSLQIGDVIEENDTSASPRRLIDNIPLLAARLMARSTVSAGASSGGNVPASRGAPTGKLVVDAKEAFVERGYVLSSEDAAALQGHLQRVLDLDLRTGPAIGGTDSNLRLSLTDILQNADGVVYPRLPRILPNWARKPLKDLTTAERDEVKDFVERYAAGADKLANALANARRDLDCGLFYVPEKWFGFAKSDQR